MHYLAIGIGATELIAVTLCVSISSKHTMKVMTENNNAVRNNLKRLVLDP